MKKVLFIILVSSCLCGCSAMFVPGSTTASLTLKNDILGMINMIERSYAPGCFSRVVDTRVVGTEGNTVKEEWVVKSCGSEVIYPVEMTPDPKGGTYFGVKTPDKDARGK